MKVDKTDRIAPSQVLGWLAEGVFHTLGALTLAALLSVVVLNKETLGTLLDAYNVEVFELTWTRLLMQGCLGAVVYSCLVIAYQTHRTRRTEGVKRVVRRARGAVMVETLIVIVPFLALTSGIAQLSILNIGAVLADIAAYQGARAAQIWHPETQMDRTGSTGSVGGWNETVKEKAMT